MEELADDVLAVMLLFHTGKIQGFIEYIRDLNKKLDACEAGLTIENAEMHKLVMEVRRRLPR